MRTFCKRRSKKSGKYCKRGLSREEAGRVDCGVYRQLTPDRDSERTGISTVAKARANSLQTIAYEQMRFRVVPELEGRAAAGALTVVRREFVPEDLAGVRLAIMPVI